MLKRILAILLIALMVLTFCACGKVTLHCDGCGKDYETVPHGRTCPHCGSGETWLLRGNEFNIKEIAVE